MSSSETFINLEAAISLIKLQSNSVLPAKFGARRQLKYEIRLVQPIYSSVFDWTIQPRSDMISFQCSEIKS